MWVVGRGKDKIVMVNVDRVADLELQLRQVLPVIIARYETGGGVRELKFKSQEDATQAWQAITDAVPPCVVLPMALHE